MITIPLSTVVSYLTRKGVGLACLEGAPWFNDDGELGALLVTTPFIAIVHGPDQEKRAHTNALYLGRDAICPAAMGWAAVVLGVARGLDLDRPIWLDFRPDWYVMWVCQSSQGAFGWAWQRPIDRDGGAPDERTRIMSGDRPLTVAARLRAVLDYEIGRDQ